MSYFNTQTFDFKDNEDELLFISAVLEAIGQGYVTEAQHLLVSRHDSLTKQPRLTLYNPAAVTQ